MEISYRRSFEKSFLQVTPSPGGGQGYALRMMQENSIEGLLPVRADTAGSGRVYSYDISFLSPLFSLYEKRRMGSGDLRSLFRGMLDVFLRCRPYLLLPQDLLLAPEYIFNDREKGAWYFVCLPGEEADEEAGRGGLLLAEFLLRRIDHTDAPATKAGYRFFALVSAGNASLAAAVREVTQMLEEAQEKEREEMREDTRRDGTAKEMTARGKREPADSVPGRGKENGKGKQTVREESRKEGAELGKREKKTAGIVRLLALLLLCTAAAAAFVLILLLGDPDPMQVGGLSFLVVVVITVCARSLLEGAGPSPGFLPEGAAGSRSGRGPVFSPAGENMPSRPGLTPQERLADAFGEAGEGTNAANTAKADDDEEVYTRLLFAGPDQDTMRRRLISLGSAEDVEIDRELILIGSSREADFILQGRSVSRLHARIRAEGSRITLTDLNSLNGTFVNGEQITPNREVPLENGDRVTFADVEYQLNISQR